MKKSLKFDGQMMGYILAFGVSLSLSAICFFNIVQAVCSYGSYDCVWQPAQESNIAYLGILNTIDVNIQVVIAALINCVAHLF